MKGMKANIISGRRQWVTQVQAETMPFLQRHIMIHTTIKHIRLIHKATMLLIHILRQATDTELTTITDPFSSQTAHTVPIHIHCPLLLTTSIMQMTQELVYSKKEHHRLSEDGKQSKKSSYSTAISSSIVLSHPPSSTKSPMRKHRGVTSSPT